MRQGEDIDDYQARSRASLEDHVRDRDQAQRMARIKANADKANAQTRPRTLAETVAAAGQRAQEQEAKSEAVVRAEHQATWRGWSGRTRRHAAT